MDRPGIVVGLAAEARLARLWNLPVAIGGGDAPGAARAAESLVGHVNAIISFGLAGGLDPGLEPGTLIVPDRVVEGAQSWTADPTLAQALGGCTGHTLLGGGAIIATAAAKRAARARTGAHAIDLESAAVARTAARHGLPFAVLRAICDPAHRDLPHAALIALDARGRIGTWRIAAAIFRHPAELPALVALGRDAAAARRALLARVRATPALNPPA